MLTKVIIWENDMIHHFCVDCIYINKQHTEEVDYEIDQYPIEQYLFPCIIPTKDAKENKHRN